ncbi:aldo/keto reductase [Corynebacterium uberis]|uniref:aldo/keto reductase n=1 Tax=Corynebacterium TaxID=1716 RepID=UPI001D0B2AA0|nr:MULTISPECIES: aldo/keto reductase [Corynebacterium]MCZ9308748.1 aldo/keto reductase [Corynebacterium sp. c6VSa_13]UDL72721.1 aldo/keto reductase [Corynebacterium uberis]UDL78615.1 aldo/keto reductase [Corynebacterium uberis]UDL80894.1 aldo/keto reductase [Corynebacterium uberis]UDL83033.1 aldo/keto reductase [Corynebacterium uberis]
MTTPRVPTVTLNDSTEMPQIGLGTWKLRGDEAITTIRTAIELGYRHIDTASLYRNEEEVGTAVRQAIAAGDVTRDELFITSKLWNTDQGSQRAAQAFQESLGRLGLDYLDLYLVHWPCPRADRYVESFQAMAKIQGLGTVQSIGVSNFYPEVLRTLIERTGITPVLNQVELHPGFSQAELRAEHARLGVLTEAWSPLGRGIALNNPVVEQIAAELDATAAQVILAWELGHGISVVPKSVDPQRLASNLAAGTITLSEQQAQAIDALDDQPGFGRIFDDPEVVEP